MIIISFSFQYSIILAEDSPNCQCNNTVIYVYPNTVRNLTVDNIINLNYKQYDGLARVVMLIVYDIFITLCLIAALLVIKALHGFRTYKHIHLGDILSWKCKLGKKKHSHLYDDDVEMEKPLSREEIDDI